MPLPEQFRTWVDNGTLVPVLGEACLRIGLERVQKPLPDQLRSIVDRMARSIEDFDPTGPERGFVEDVAEQVPLAINRDVVDKQPTRAPPAYEDDVVELCRHLARASTAASRLFAEGLHTKSAVFGYAEHIIDVSEDGIAELRQRIDQAVVAAGTLQQRAESAQREWLAANGVRATEEWTHEDRALFEMLGPKQMKARLQALRETLDDPKLVGSMIEFLTAMLWHCYRFDSDVPPTSSELALQISLTTSRQPATPTWLRPRRTHLNWIRALGRGEVARHVASALRSTDAGPKRKAHQARTDFYRQMAHYLLGPPRETGKAYGPPYRVAFVTTFDLELETALIGALDRSECFHVVIPVVVEQKRATPDNEERIDHLPTWLLGTFKRADGQAAATFWNWGVPVTGHRDDSTDPPVQLTGPVIVKLCGSPLHQTRDESTPDRIVDLGGSVVGSHPELRKALEQLKKAKEANQPATSELSAMRIEEQDVLYHDITLAEVDHLERAPLFANRLPQWVFSTVGLPTARGMAAKRWRTREIMFVGLPVIDWIDRLWVFFQKKGFEPPPGSGYSKRHTFLAVDAMCEPVSAETLDALEIIRHHVRLEQVTAAIAASPASQARGARIA